MEVEDAKVDYDELTLNPVLTPNEAETNNELDAKNKVRRFWSPKEEDTFFEIWGRDNWCLTRHGKNKIYFGKWSEELKNRFQIDIKPEEIQAKVNQTRAKFRQVKKTLENGNGTTRWKKYDLIDKILKNQYRPADADPIPEKALENNRDISVQELMKSSQPSRQPSPNSITSNSTHEPLQANAATVTGNTEIKEEKEHSFGEGTVADTSVADVFSGSSVIAVEQLPPNNYNTDIYNGTIVESESEYLNNGKSKEFPNDYETYQYQPTQPTLASNCYAETHENGEPQLLELRTPHQQQQQQFYAQTQLKDETDLDVYLLQQQQLQPAVLQQQIQPQLQLPTTNTYEHSVSVYASTNHLPNQQTIEPLQPLPSVSPLSTLTPASPVPPSTVSQPITPTNQVLNIPTTHTNGCNQNDSNSTTTVMQPPVRASQISTVRKRRTYNTANNYLLAQAANANSESVEMLYIEEVRRRNQILEEQRQIEVKRMHLSERQNSLLEEYLPRIVDLQQKILDKLTSNQK